MNTLAKGNAWRRRVEVWLEAAGFRTTIRGIGFAGDDILAARKSWDGVPVLTLSIEAKNHKTITLADFVDQAERQAESYDDGTLPVVVIHRRGKADVDQGYVVMPGWAFIELTTR